MNPLGDSSEPYTAHTLKEGRHDVVKYLASKGGAGSSGGIKGGTVFRDSELLGVCIYFFSSAQTLFLVMQLPFSNSCVRCAAEEGQ